ncbi:hypothetical protein EDB92DRAFT_1264184 [Lactarius akahatsu]|uniref:Uncharacterized protein n=1 Tax=Lactarius akahatsu TaxID=416441 RepID=A0AAD4LB21_9AGAM|nr:hypothetical protein EDB92DRAFT_1264184 [Lactarius akahatsu]
MPTTRSQIAAAAAAALVAPGLATSAAPTADDLAPPAASASSLTTLTASAGSLPAPTAGNLAAPAVGSLPTPTAGNLPATTAGSLATPAATTSMKGAKYDLWCLCKGYSEPNLVSIAPGEYLYNLKKEILRECGTESGPLKGANAMNIVLTKIDMYYSGEVSTSEISRRILSGDESSEVLNNPTITISSVWPTEPLPRHISVFVHRPSDTALGKRPRGGLDVIHDAKIFDDPPSVVAKPSKYKTLQNHPSQKILDGRPQADSVPPLSLLYHGFGDFMDNSSLHKPVRADGEQRKHQQNQI